MWASATAGFGSHIHNCAKSSDGNTKVHDHQSPPRRSANYQPPNWDFDDIQSLSNEYAGERYVNQSRVLKEQVKMMLDDQVMGSQNQLELIDNLQRLGLSCHFEDKIQSIFGGIYHRNHVNNMPNQRGLHETALEFRLLRQYGFDVSQEIFDIFKDEKGVFKSSVCDDAKGMLSLYEASYLNKNESNLELAREFTSKYLKKHLDDEKRMDQQLVALVQHALELPLHWRVIPLEARWFIDEYEKRSDMNPFLLELAKLNFNIVQATYQNDLKYASRCWKSTCLAEKLKFFRDRLVECFFWSVGSIPDSQHGYCRRMIAMVGAFITLIDDVYDVYGTLDELELFTDAIQSWDIEGIDRLPDYMKLCYLAVYNSINEMAYNALKEQGVNVIPYLRKAWADLCRAYLKEANWYFSGYVPTMEEYLDNASRSIGIYPVLVHAYICVHNPIKEADLEYLETRPNIAQNTVLIVRFADDLGTSREEIERGDVPKSIQCYMKQTGASEENARKYIKFLMSETCKQMNKDCLSSSPFSPTFIGIAMNIARTAQCIYEHGDGHGHQNAETRHRILALLFDPIRLP
ncbi:hypothetical protein ACH5RR_034063 [Cinchona calisaya]|uniref:myrcene synthase n=1 Tax=Cinchona calisaya TaxID=153742 RepID=A0ABD2Y9T5_9GENT